MSVFVCEGMTAQRNLQQAKLLTVASPGSPFRPHHTQVLRRMTCLPASVLQVSGSHALCRSGSVRSFGIKRVCSVASADAIDSHCTQQQLAGSIMIPVPGSSNNLQQVAGSYHHAPAAAAKRSSKTGSTSSSLEHNTYTLAAAAGQEVASGSGRKLAPIKTALPRGPRMRLNGRLLSPEEAQKHLQAVAAAAAAATSGRSLSRAQSPSVTTGRGRTSSPAGPYPCSSMSPSTGAPCNSAGNSSGMCGPAAFKPAHAPAAPPGPKSMGAHTQVLSALDVLPENFIPTPEGMGTWHTLASTLEDGCGGATSRGCSSPVVCCSYTELLMAEEGDACVLPAAAAAADGSSFTAHTSRSMGAAAGAAAGGLSAFAAHSMAPWPMQLPQQQQRAARHMQLASAGSVSGQPPLSSSSCPVHIPVDNGSSSWTCSKLLAGSVSGSNGSSGSGPNSLAASLGPNNDPDISQLLGTWVQTQPELQQQQVRQTQQQVGVVTFTGMGGGAVTGSGGSFVGSAAWGAPVGSAPAAAAPMGSAAAAASTWKPAFGAAGGDRIPALGASNGMVPTPGLSAVSSAPVLTSLPQQQQVMPQQLSPASRVKGTASRAKKHSKSAKAAAAASKPTLPLQLPAQVAALTPQQQVLMVGDGAQQVVLSQQELLALVQQNMAASFASGYMMAQQSSMQGGPQQQGPPQMQLQQQQPLLKPVASVGAFVMPPAAVLGADGAASGAGGMRAGGAAAGGNGGGYVTTAAAASALGRNGDMARLVGGSGVDDILPSLQELLTDCC